MILPIRTGDDPILHEVAAPVYALGTDRPPGSPRAELDAIVRNMRDTMRRNDGIGIAAPQVGLSLRLIIAEVDGHSYALANPRIIGRSEKMVGEWEGCLSLPGKSRYIRRHRRVSVHAYDMDHDEEIVIEAKDLMARVLQHEIDHLNGVLITDSDPDSTR